MAKMKLTISDLVATIGDAFKSTEITTGECELFSTSAMVCPMCKVTVPPRTLHRCKVRKKVRR